MILSFMHEIYVLFVAIAPYLLLGLGMAGMLNFLFSKEWILKHIGTNNFSSVFKAVMVGIPLPLCSCSVIPTAVTLSQKGASRAAVVGFLISTPQTGVDSIIATFGMMGGLFAVYRPFAALVMGMIGGLLVVLLNPSPFTPLSEPDEKPCCCCSGKAKQEEKPVSLSARIFKGLKSVYVYAFETSLDAISLHFIIGLGIAALISLLIPSEMIYKLGIQNGIGAMILMSLIGIPLYICATASIPIAVTLMLKGFSPGAAFVFLTTGSVTNVISILILLNILGRKTTGIYLGAVVTTSIISGLFLDYLFSVFSISGTQYLKFIEAACHQTHSFFYSFCTFLFFIFLLLSLYRKCGKIKKSV